MIKTRLLLAALLVAVLSPARAATLPPPGWRLPKNRIDFWTRVEKFLNRHIGPQQ
jgi:ABC-type sugar transport system substrate-binding protein